MSGFFNYDNPVWRFVGKFWDIMILQVLWVVFSLPIFTIGASTTAVYYVTLKLVKDEEGYTFRSFFKSFRENFKQSTLIWLVFLAVGIIIGVDIRFVLEFENLAPSLRTLLMAAFLAFLFLYTSMFLYIFPLQSRFYMSVKKEMVFAFCLTFRHLISTILMLICDGVFLIAVILIPQLLILAILFGFPLIAFVNSFILDQVLKKYEPREEDLAEETQSLEKR